ncbi:unnamed protein product [Ranitomeya imitator]|uniref:Uncharacterized protein n=1 Tax=Ranitomeya imitator TaxID=111125 RepID=A0ABN9MJK7_9NEOB|nr:unnamed protein product [Ranitomeya imitator]
MTCLWLLRTEVGEHRATAYHRCRTDTERHNLLSDILVRRGEGVTSTSRRVGPELSKRIYQQLMSAEAELSLDL